MVTCVTLDFKKRTYEGIVDVESETDPVITEVPLGAWHLQSHQPGTSTPNVKCVSQRISVTTIKTAKKILVFITLGLLGKF